MEESGKVAVFGSSGLIGSSISLKLIELGYSVIAVGRKEENVRSRVPNAWKYVEFDHRNGNCSEIIDGTKAVFNFSGAPIFKKWKGDYKSEIYNSRVNLTSSISDAIKSVRNPPSLFVNGTASGIYGYDHWDDRDITEDDPAADDFWGVLVRDWEKAANSCQSDSTRVVNIRTSVVLDSTEGALEQLVKVFNRGLGGPIKPGNQWFPWIHLDDEVGISIFPLMNNGITGPINAASPNVPRMKEFAETLGKVLNKPSRIKVPITIIRLMFGDVADLLINGKKVVPRNAIAMGYTFNFPDLEGALRNLLSK